MSSQKAVIAVFILALFAGNIILGAQYFTLQKELKKTQAEIRVSRKNDKVFAFTRLFVEKVLKADGEVSFEDRLALENAVRDTNDQEIIDQWKKFTGSSDEKEAQGEVKNLLGLLVEEIK